VFPLVGGDDDIPGQDVGNRQAEFLAFVGKGLAFQQGPFMDVMLLDNGASTLNAKRALSGFGRNLEVPSIP